MFGGNGGRYSECAGNGAVDFYILACALRLLYKRQNI